mmetsp:Transcript_31253/g.90863  ORF Transcript_31253/g.90863 Transcript_31253/m.90863 type:complete len:93 (+) Transcript_31253:439-717(+)
MRPLTVDLKNGVATRVQELDLLGHAGAEGALAQEQQSSRKLRSAQNQPAITLAAEDVLLSIKVSCAVDGVVSLARGKRNLPPTRLTVVSLAH